MDFKMKRFLKIFLCTAVIAVIVVSCSTKRNTALTRGYHNMTSFFNVYWNGREAQKELELKLYNEAKENYFKVLPAFPFSFFS